jgi:hypothetical protein
MPHDVNTFHAGKQGLVAGKIGDFDRLEHQQRRSRQVSLVVTEADRIQIGFQIVFRIAGHMRHNALERNAVGSNGLYQLIQIGLLELIQLIGCPGSKQLPLSLFERSPA